MKNGFSLQNTYERVFSKTIQIDPADPEAPIQVVHSLTNSSCKLHGTFHQRFRTTQFWRNLPFSLLFLMAGAISYPALLAEVLPSLVHNTTADILSSFLTFTVTDHLYRLSWPRYPPIFSYLDCHFPSASREVRLTVPTRNTIHDSMDSG